MKKPNITILNVPLAVDRYPLKATHTMKPIGITIHETDNNAPARNEIAYMQRNDLWKSFHFAVDEKEIIQGLPLNRNGWHSGDGPNGRGNRRTIAIEICRNYRTDDLTAYYKARENAEKLVGYLLYAYGWTAKDIYTHNDWSGKNCPRVIRRENYLNTFKANAMKIKDAYTGVKETPINEKTDREIAEEILYTKHKYGDGNTRKQNLGTRWRGVQDIINEILYGKKAVAKPQEITKDTYKVGDNVRFNQLASNSTKTAKIVDAKIRTGIITRVYKNRTYPYLVGGNLGFLNDKMIIGINTPILDKTRPQALKVGDRVLLSQNAKGYAVGGGIPNQYKGRWYTIQQLRPVNNPTEALLKELYSWVWVKDIRK